MRVSVRIYRNTGYDLLNRPDSSATIEKLATDYEDIDDIYVVQNVGLSEIRLPLTYVQAKGIDYIRLSSMQASNPDDRDIYYPSTDEDEVDDVAMERVYYVVTGYYSMINENTCSIPIKEDYIATLGITQTQFLSGRVNVAHVPEVTWNLCTIPETRFSPSGILKLEQKDVGPTSSTVDKKVIIASTAGLPETAASSDALISTAGSLLQLAAGIISPDNSFGNVSVAVPRVVEPTKPYASQFRLFKLSGDGTSDHSTITYVSPYHCYVYDETNEDNVRCMNYVRSLGLVDMISAFYEVDSYYLQLEHPATTPCPATRYQYELDESEGKYIKVENEVSMDMITDCYPNWIILGENVGDFDANFDYVYTVDDYKARNLKCYAGVNNAYTIVSKCTGNSITVNPEDLRLSDTSKERPVVIITADARPNGYPRAFFKWYNGGLNTQMIGTSGLKWNNHQTNYFGQYGSDLVNNQYNLNANKMTSSFVSQELGNIGKLAAGVATLGAVNHAGISDAMINKGLSMQNTGLSMMNNLSNVPYYGGSKLGKGFANLADNAVFNSGNLLAMGGNTLGGLGWGLNSYGGQIDNALDTYSAQAVGSILATPSAAASIWTSAASYNSNMQQLQLAQQMATGSTKAPVVEFPYEEGSRDYFGNGFTVYRTHYTKSQLEQLDNFYDLWGYQLGGIEIVNDTRQWLNNREYFNFISMTDVSLKRTDLSMLEREGLAADLSFVRLWHDNKLPIDWKPSDHNLIKVEA